MVCCPMPDVNNMSAIESEDGAIWQQPRLHRVQVVESSDVRTLVRS